MTEVLENIEEKYDSKKKELEIHRSSRERFFKDAEDWEQKRDELNKQTKELFARANEAKERREKLNEEIRNLKSQKDEILKELMLKRDELKEIRDKVIRVKASERPSIKSLKKRLEDLEMKQQTQNLTKEKEDELIEEIRKLHAMIERYKKEEEEFVKNGKEYQEKKAEYLSIKIKLDELNQKINGLIAEREQAHQQAMELFEQAYQSKAKSDEAHQNYINALQKAKEEDDRVKEIIKELKDYEKIIVAIRQTQTTQKKQERETELKKVAEDIYEKFKKGEPLTTEDILILQKAGFL